MGNIFNKFKKNYYQTTNYHNKHQDTIIIYCGDVPVVIPKKHLINKNLNLK